MNILKSSCFVLLLTLMSIGCKSSEKNVLQQENINNSGVIINRYGDTVNKINKSDSEWKEVLTPQEYYVIREKGTERSFTGDLLDNKKAGFYTCAACELVLFNSDHKFKSGTGWPSFYEVEDENMIVKDTDHDLGYPRTELTCARCGGHLGHVFDDGPKPTGLRYCINSVSLNFVERVD